MDFYKVINSRPKLYLAIFVFFIVLYTFLQVFTLGNENTSANLNSCGNFMQSGFSDEHVEEARQNQQLEKKLRGTAVLIYWKTSSRFKQTLLELLDTNVFSEFVIWNNRANKDMEIDILSFLPQTDATHFDETDAGNLPTAMGNFDIQRFRYKRTTNSPLIWFSIVRSPRNLNTFGRFLGCAASSSAFCYSQDDTFSTKHYFQALYSQYIQKPHVVHTVAEPLSYYGSHVWSFFNQSSHIHSSLAYLNAGVFYSRESAKQFTKLAEKYIHIDYIPMADLFFTTWLNNPPVVLEVNLFPLTVELMDDFSSAFHIWDSKEAYYRAQYKAITTAPWGLSRHLILQSQGNMPDIERFSMLPVNPPLHERISRAISSSNPHASANKKLHVLISNMEPYSMSKIRYDPFQDTQRAVFKTPKNPIYEDPVDNSYFCDRYCPHPFSFAVDGNPESYWQSKVDVKVGHYFGVDLLEITRQPIIYVIVGHSFQSALEVDISLDGREWKSVDTLFTGFLTKTGNTFIYNFENAPSLFQQLRYARFVVGEALRKDTTVRGEPFIVNWVSPENPPKKSYVWPQDLNVKGRFLFGIPE